MKPVFKEERSLLERKLGFTLPDDIWRNGHSLYLNSDKETKMLTFKVVNREKLIVTSNKINEILENYKNKSYAEEIEENEERLYKLEEESISKTKEFILANPGHKLRPSISGGKDSDVMWFIIQKVFKELNITDYTLDFMNKI